MKRRLLVLGIIGLTGCVHAADAPGARVADVERTRAALAGHDAQTLAPQAFAEADEALRAAKEAERKGDSVSADLESERAVASYQHAVAIARLAHAKQDEITATGALGQAVEQTQRYSAARKSAEREADDLDKQLKIARETQSPAASGTTDPEREKARLVAAQSLATQARLLCSAARLVSDKAPGLTEAEAAVTDLEKKLEGAPRPAPIDLAGRARAGCLSALTKARRAGAPENDPADALLGELSRSRVALVDPSQGSVSKGTDLAPSRDERGVVVTVRSLFQGDALSKGGADMLKELGRVAAAHPSFAVQVVVHSATPPSTADAAADKKRGETVTKALAEGGAKKTQLELAGARAPVFDPADAKRRAQNARFEIVFVGG